MNIIDGRIDYKLLTQKIIINRQYTIKFKNENIYINYMINHIKDVILRKYNNLNHIQIKIEIFNKYNHIHQFIINTLLKLYNIDFIHKNRLILICIYENNNLIFISNLFLN